jgi:WD40 repeat protein
MNFDKLFVAFQNEVLCDLLLTLTDKKNNKIKMNVHKIVLYSSCTYFEKQLINFKEKNLDHIEIEVPNASVSYDIIMSFYGQKTNHGNYPKWYHILQSYLCFDFFCMEFKEQLYDLVVPLSNLQSQIWKGVALRVPEEGFELLLDVIDMIGYNKKTIRLLNKNIPKNFDLSKLPNELILKMMQRIESDTSLLVSGSDDRAVRVWNITNGKLKHTLVEHYDAVKSAKISSDNTLIVSGGDDDVLIIWDATSGKIIHRLIDHTDCINSICFSHDDKYIASGSDDMFIKIWNPIKGELINTLEYVHEIYCVIFSHDDKYLLSSNSDETIIMWDYLEGKMIKQIDVKSNVFDICYSPSGKYFATVDFKNIKIWSADSLCLVNEFNDCASTSISFAHNDTLLSGTAGNEICVFEGDNIYDPWCKKSVSNIHKSKVFTINCSSENIIATGGDDGVIKLWEYNEDNEDNNEPYKLKMVLSRHTGRVNSLVLSQYKDELLDRLREYCFEKNICK